jgi:hypothetical protein
VARIAGVAASPTVDGLTGELSMTSIGYQACALGVGGQSTAGLTFDNAPLAIGNNLKQRGMRLDRCNRLQQLAVRVYVVVKPKTPPPAPPAHRITHACTHYGELFLAFVCSDAEAGLHSDNQSHPARQVGHKVGCRRPRECRNAAASHTLTGTAQRAPAAV